MCGLCGILGGRGHWSETATTPEAFAGRSETHTWHRERQGRARLVNRVLGHYGLRLDDWGGNAYVLKSRTGRNEIVNHLNQVWAEAERLSHRDCDPLDDALLAKLADRGA
jgi:hypothetical protein